MELAAVLRERVLRVFKKTYSSNFRIIVYVGRSGVFFSVFIRNMDIALFCWYLMSCGVVHQKALIFFYYII